MPQYIVGKMTSWLDNVLDWRTSSHCLGGNQAISVISYIQSSSGLLVYMTNQLGGVLKTSS